MLISVSKYQRSGWGSHKEGICSPERGAEPPRKKTPFSQIVKMVSDDLTSKLDHESIPV
jgi:hypothetical protein